MRTLTRTVSTLLATGATAAALTAAAPVAFAAPSTGSSGSSSGSSGSSSGSAGCSPRSAADRQFLRASHEDEKSCEVQDAAIGLAKAQCGWLDTYGNSAHNRIVLAEKSRGAVDYPYTFLHAAVKAYCPQHDY